MPVTEEFLSFLFNLMSNIPLLLTLAIAPGVAICIYIFTLDRFNREPRRLLVRSFLLGIVSAFIAIALQAILLPAAERLLLPGIVSAAIKAFFIVALTEEWSKYIMVRAYSWPKPEFDEPFDGIVYAVMVSMGFATIENVGYVLMHGVGTALLRMFLSVPAHATFAVLMGYHMGLAKFQPGKKWAYLLRGLTLAIFFHGVFDFFLFLQEHETVTRYVSTGLLTLGAIISFIIALNLSNRAIHAHAELSRETNRDGIS